MNQSRQTNSVRYTLPVSHAHQVRRMPPGMHQAMPQGMHPTMVYPQFAVPVTMMPQGNWPYQNMQAVPGFASSFYGPLRPEPPRVSPPRRAKKVLDIRDPNERTTSPPEQTSTETKVTAVQLCTPAAEESTDTSEEPLQGENEVSEHEEIAHECTIDDQHKAEEETLPACDKEEEIETPKFRDNEEESETPKFRDNEEDSEAPTISAVQRAVEECDKAVRDLEAMVYDRMFIMRIKDLAEKSQYAPCPIEEKLIKLGLDMKAMPAVSTAFKKQSNRNDYNKPRQHVQNKVAGAGRVRQHGPRCNDQPRSTGRHASNRASDVLIERQKPVQPSHKAENAYKVVRDVDKITKTAKDVRGLLNKITPTTMSVLTNKFLELEVYKDDEIRAIVLDIIFDKAVEEPKFCPMYSDLCKSQVDEELRKDATQSFRNGILTKAQKTFENRESGIEDLKRELSEASDDKRKKELEMKIEELNAKERRRIRGNIGLIGELFRNNLITPKIIAWCLVHLLRRDESEGTDEESVECAVRMISGVGKEWNRVTGNNKENFKNVDNFIDYLKSRAKENKYSARIRFSIIDLVELRARKWVPRKSAQTGPKTVKEIHEEARKEQMDNKIAREKFENQQQRNYQSRNGHGNRRDSRSNSDYIPNKIMVRGEGHKQTILPLKLQHNQNDSLRAGRSSFADGASGGGVAQKEKQRNSNRAGHSDRRGASATSASQKRTVKAVEITKADDALVKRIRGDVGEYAEGAASLEETFEGIKQFYSRPSQEKENESKPEEKPLHSPELVFFCFMEAAVSRNNQPSYGQLLARCLDEKELKTPALNGIALYCRKVVASEDWLDMPDLWDRVATVFRHAMLCAAEVYQGSKPSLNDFRAAFQESNGGEGQKSFALLVSVIKLLLAGLPDEDRDVFLEMSFAEFDDELKGNADLKKALEEEKLEGLGEDGPKNLYEFLTKQS